MNDIYGQALVDYQSGHYTEDIKTYSSLDEEDFMPLPYLFRSYQEMPIIEQKALAYCQGSVLDIGCGAGSHSLYLQSKNFDVTALDRSKGAITTCQKRGIKTTVCTNILAYSDKKFDTLLLLMNGVGIAGKLARMHQYLAHFKTLLNPEGQILLDSSDIIYMFEQDVDGGYWIPDSSSYYGEVTFQMEYKNQISPAFDWLYLDFNSLANVAELHDLHCELLHNGPHYDYLAKLYKK